MCEMVLIDKEQLQSECSPIFYRHILFFEMLVYQEYNNLAAMDRESAFGWAILRRNGASLPILISLQENRVVLRSQLGEKESSSLVASLITSLFVLNRMMWEFDGQSDDFEAYDQFYGFLKSWIFDENNAYLSNRDKRIIYSAID